MATPLDQLPTFDLWGTQPANPDFNPGFDPFGPEWISYRDNYTQYQPPSTQEAQGGGNAGGAPAEPPPDKLDPVEVTAPKPKPPEPTPAFVAPPIPPQVIAPPAAVATGAGVGLAEILAPIAMLLFPSPTAPRSMDEAPDVLPEVKVSGARGKPPPSFAMPFDFLLPPNWNDLLNWDETRPWYSFMVPDLRPKDGDTRTRERPNDGATRAPGSDPALPSLDPVDVFARRARPAPRSSPAPDLFGDAFELAPGFPVSVPGIESIPELQPAPRVAPAPRLKPITLVSPYDFTLPVPGIGADPFADPTLEPFAPLLPDVPVRAPPLVPTTGAAPSPLLPIGTLDPIPQDPIFATLPSPRIPQRVPTDSNTCTCADKKPRKPRKQRERCFAGSYRETRTSTKKNPSQWVDCETGEPIGSQER